MPAVGQLEEPRLVLGRAEEPAAHVPEELALEQRVVDRGTVDGDEPAIAPRADAVERARHELLAGAGLAGHERQAHVRGEAPDHPEEILHARAAADHPVELEPPRQVAFHRQDAAPAVDLLAHARQQLIEPAEVERLGQIVHRAELDRLDGGVDRRVAGHEHGLAMRVDIADRAQDVEAADLGHPQIDHHEVGPARLDQRDGRAAVGAGRRRRNPRARRSATRRRGCPVHRRRSPAMVVDSSCAPHPVEDHGRQRRPERPQLERRHQQRARLLVPELLGLPVVGRRRHDDDRHRGRVRRMLAAPRLEVGREDPAVDERRRAGRRVDSAPAPRRRDRSSVTL